MSVIPLLEDLEYAKFDRYIADEIMFGDHIDPYTRIAELRARSPVIEGDCGKLMGLPGEPSFVVLSDKKVG